MVAMVACLSLAAGCAHKNYNVANPVVGPAPPRIKGAATVLAQSEEAPSLQLVSYDAATILPDSAIVARVNGRPVLAADLLERYELPLSKLRQQAPPAEYRKAQDMIIKRDLENLVTTMLAVDAVKAKLDKTQLENVQQQLEDGFNNQKIPELKKELGANSLPELEAKLQAQGASLEMIRRMAFDSALASQYVAAKLGDDPNPSAAELRDRYNRQKEKYARPLKVKWQQLHISIARVGSEQKARQLMDEALAAVRAGTDFGEVVKKYSDGPQRANGGNYDWTQPSSLVSPELRDALEKLPAGETTDVLKVGNTLQVVRVTERQEATYQQFEELQNELRQEYIQEWNETRMKKILEELRSTAVIETIYDENQPAIITF